MSTALAKLGIVAEPAAIYHAHPAISKGKLSDFRASHRMYWHQHVACDGSGEVTEAHESYAVETLGCPHCGGSGKRGQ